MFALGAKRPASPDQIKAEESVAKSSRFSATRATLVLSACIPPTLLPSISTPTASSTEKETASSVNKLDDIKALSCKCKRSKCLKQYCECYRAGETCGEHCECDQCKNRDKNDEQRRVAMEQTKKASSFAFAPDWKALTVGGSATSAPDMLSHPKGCRCRRSKCRKKYCECYQMGVPCSSKCECMNCHNRGASKGKIKTTYRLSQAPSRLIPDKKSVADENEHGVDSDETMLKESNDGLEETMSTTQGSTSMSIMERSPTGSLCQTPQQDTAYPIELSVESSFKLSTSPTRTSERRQSKSPLPESACGSAVLSPVNPAANSLGGVSSEGSKLMPRLVDCLMNSSGETAAGDGEPLQSNDSVISMESSMDGDISWRDLEFCSSPSFMDLDTM